MLTQECLKSVLKYDMNTGNFIWIKNVSASGRKDNVAGGKTGKGYIQIGVNKQRHLAHRLVFLYVLGRFPKEEVDHIDHNPSNNKWDNLREVTRRENSLNQKMKVTNTSGLMGVDYSKSKQIWEARIKHNNKCIHLKRSNDFFEVCCARKSAEVKYGYHSNHGVKVYEI